MGPTIPGGQLPGGVIRAHATLLARLSKSLDVAGDGSAAASEAEVEVGLTLDVVVELARLGLDLQPAHLGKGTNEVLDHQFRGSCFCNRTNFEKMNGPIRGYERPKARAQGWRRTISPKS